MSPSVTRRTLGRGALAAGALAAAGPGRAALAQGSAAPSIALQLYTVRSVGPIEAQVAVAAASGYSAVEVSNFGELAPADAVALLRRHGLTLASTHIGFDGLRRDPGATAARELALGNRVAILGSIPVPDSVDGWRAAGRELDLLGAILGASGIQLGFHNHAPDVTAIDGVLPIDILAEEAAPESLVFQIDVGWVARVDPALVMPLLERHAGRIHSIHAKDLAPPGGNPEQEGWATVGQGIQDWPAIVGFARDTGVPWLIVENDRPVDPARMARESLEYLERLQAG